MNKFTCCGGNDEDPLDHCMDCPIFDHFMSYNEIDSLFEEHGWSSSLDYYPVVKAIEDRLIKKLTNEGII